MRKTGLNPSATERLRHDWSDPQRLPGYSVASKEKSENPYLKIKDEIREAYPKDPLTGLYDRQTMDRFLKKFFESGWPFALVFADLNDFGRFNKGGLHEKGDYILKTAAQTFSEMINHDHESEATLGRVHHPGEFEGKDRRNIAGRWGGDEFIGLVLLPLTNDDEQRREIMEQIVAKIHAASEDREFSFAVGYAIEDGSGKHNASTIFSQADRMMSEDKKRQKAN